MKINQGAKEKGIEAAANTCVAFGRKLSAQTEQVKKEFRVQLRATWEMPDRVFGLVLNEAAALAWETGYPHLLFPALAAEKIRAATEWNTRQKGLHQKNPVHVMSN